MTVKDLGIPKFQVRIKGRPNPVQPVLQDHEFTGQDLLDFVDHILSGSPHYSPSQIAEVRTASRIIGRAVPDKALGEPFGASFGRYWYAVK